MFITNLFYANSITRSTQQSVIQHKMVIMRQISRLNNAACCNLFAIDIKSMEIETQFHLIVPINCI